MGKRKDDGISQQTEDAIVNKIAERLAEKGLLGDMLKHSGKDRKVIEDSLERHAARQRAAGKPGW
jgi:hypothetical protein